jgi:hypothetical protein
MTDTVASEHARRFVAQGWVAVENALDPSFCEEVVARGFERLGTMETEPATWPQGWHNLPVEGVFRINEVAPRAASVLDELVGGRECVRFGDIPDNLIFNFRNDDAPWEPSDWRASGAGYHKDGDWFRHFLDSPEQGLLGVVFWRDVAADQGATFIAADSIAPVARHLASHPEGLLPHDFGSTKILEQCRNFQALTGKQGTIVWAHPYLVHSKSVNQTDRPRVISNTSVMLSSSLQFCRDDDAYTPVEQVVLDALGVSSLSFTRTGERERIVSDRERQWNEETPSE